MRRIRFVLKGGIFILAIIIITEIALRLTMANRLQKWNECQYQADSALGYRYKVNSEGVIYNDAFSQPYKINSHGFPGEEFSTKKPTGTYRVAVIGASEETGLNTNGPRNFINIAEGLFKKNGYPVDIINLAIDGHGRCIKNIKLSRLASAEYGADMILFRDLGFPLADLRQYRTTYKNILIKYTDTSKENLDAAKAYIDNELSHKTFRLYLYDYSYIYRWMVKHYLSEYQNQKSRTWQWFGRLLFVNGNKMECYARRVIFWPRYEFDQSFYTEEESIRALQDLRDEISKRNTRFIIFNTYEINNVSSMKQYYAKYGLAYLPLQVEFKDEYSFGKEDGHSSQKGHEALGYALFNALKDTIAR